MKVLKFGGASIASPERMKHAASIIEQGKGMFVVVSATAGTTDLLYEICTCAEHGRQNEAESLISRLHDKMAAYANGLFEKGPVRDKALGKVEDNTRLIQQLAAGEYSLQAEKQIVACGEMFATDVMSMYLETEGKPNKIVYAPGFIRVDEEGRPNMEYISQHLNALFDADGRDTLYLTQGFVCSDCHNQIDNLGRGGGDYTATLIAAAIGAEEVQIWADVEGMRNNDPRFVSRTFAVDSLSYAEAGALARYGAKILHPKCVDPIAKCHIPLRIRYTARPECRGTLVSDCSCRKAPFKAVAACDKIAVVRVTMEDETWERLAQVAGIFKTYHKDIDQLTTGAHILTLTASDSPSIERIHNSLKDEGFEVEVEKGMSMICIVGNLEWHTTGIETTILDALRDIPLCLISYDGSGLCMTVATKSEYKQDALEALNRELFEKNKQD